MYLYPNRPWIGVKKKILKPPAGIEFNGGECGLVVLPQWKKGASLKGKLPTFKNKTDLSILVGGFNSIEKYYIYIYIVKVGIFPK